MTYHWFMVNDETYNAKCILFDAFRKENYGYLSCACRGLYKCFNTTNFKIQNGNIFKFNITFLNLFNFRFLGS